MKIEDFKIGEAIQLVKMGSWPATWHLFGERDVAAILTAWHSQRPLLVRGDPGLGKSQLAQAIAQVTQRQLISIVVNARTEPEDLLFRFDHVKRLATAQLASAIGTQNIQGEIAPKKFLEPGALWWTLNAKTAQEQLNSLDEPPNAPPPPLDENGNLAYTPKGNVLLIDEIDKADTDLPNALLEVLNNNAFEIPITREIVDAQFDASDDRRPFIVISSNDERALPHAFIRRCISLRLRLQMGDSGHKQLGNIAAAHPDVNALDQSVIREAAQTVLHARERATEGEYRPGTSEFLDLLRALYSRYPNDKNKQMQALVDIAEYAVAKSDNG